MYRAPVLVISILTLVILLIGSYAPVRAQEATPVPTVIGAITIEETRFGYADDVPVGPAVISSYRIDMPPGTQLAVDPEPGLALYRVASGTVTAALADEITLTRDGVPDEVVAGGEEVQLAPGDGFMWMQETGGELRNTGAEPVVLLVVVIFPEAGLADAEVRFATPSP